MNERELKFRIYSFTDKLWHYFDIYEGYPQGIYGAVTPPQQYIEIKDRNYREIYEGDIVEKKSIKYEVKIGSYFTKNDVGHGVHLCINGGTRDFPTTICDMDKDYEIIGNIIENPNLLT